MKKVLVILVLIFFISPTNHVFAHVKHYKDLNSIEFDIFRNNKYIGKHVFTFKKIDNQLSVESEISFQIKKLGVVLYKYYVIGEEIYKNGELVKFNSKTDQNGKSKYVNITKEKNELIIDGSSFKGNVPINYILGTWWNHEIVKSEAQISAVSGRIIKQNVTFLGEEVIKFGEKSFNTLHFNFSSTDQKLGKDKKLNTDVWYDEETLNWVKASFKKKGDWEYILKSIK